MTNEKFVTVATSLHAVYAHILRTKLEEEGIECIIVDENISTINPLYSLAIGGVKLQTKSSDSMKAKKIIDNLNDEL